MTSEDDWPEVGAGENPRLDYVREKRTHPNWIEHQVGETVTQISDQQGPYIIYTVKRTLVATAWNPGYNQDAECKCGDPYYRHFDTYEEMYPVGCKYCECEVFQPKD